MESISSNKRKIFNDPIYGFITIPDEFIFDVIEHPYFQRLRRIKQLGLTHLVYPSAQHTRFQHAMGAMFLVTQAIDVLRSKGLDITNEEAQGVTLAILLHDIGHGPFSHSLENNIVYNMGHEDLSLIFMYKLNDIFKGKLSLAIDIFTNVYPKKFLHQLVSGQLDMDRLDYLKRDSFFTGVVEGAIGTERIIKMLNVVDDHLVVESKGIYSIENFITSRRLMYWQVYLHKTSLAAETLLLNTLKRANYLAEKGVELFASPALHKFLYNKFNKDDFKNNPDLLDDFASLDDADIVTSIKVWEKHEDRVLSKLCHNLTNRKLSRIELQNKAFDESYVNDILSKVQEAYSLNVDEAKYFVSTAIATNNIYNPADEKINILYRNGDVVDIAEASDQLSASVLSKTVTKHYLCYPKKV